MADEETTETTPTDPPAEPPVTPPAEPEPETAPPVAAALAPPTTEEVTDPDSGVGKPAYQAYAAQLGYRNLKTGETLNNFEDLHPIERVAWNNVVFVVLTAEEPPVEEPATEPEVTPEAPPIN